METLYTSLVKQRTSNRVALMFNPRYHWVSIICNKAVWFQRLVPYLLFFHRFQYSFFAFWITELSTCHSRYPQGIGSITDLNISGCMMTSSNGNISRVTGPLCGEFIGPGEFPTQRPVTRSFDVFFDLRLNKRLSKQPWSWWFETPSWSLWRHCNVERKMSFCAYLLARNNAIFDKDETQK